MPRTRRQSIAFFPHEIPGALELAAWRPDLSLRTLFALERFARIVLHRSWS